MGGGGGGVRLVFANTVPVGLSVHARGQLRWLKQQGIEVIAVTSPGIGLSDLRTREQVDVVVIPMKREVAPLRDARALLSWIIVLRRLRPDVLVYGSPKASLLASVAARLTGVRRRVYIVHGARFEGVQGVSRTLLVWVERLICSLSSEILAVSESVRVRFLDARIGGPERILVVAGGSCNGVDLRRFTPPTASERATLRLAHGLERDAAVVGFVGRLTSEKGLTQLEAVVQRLETALGTENDLTVLIAGWEEDEGLHLLSKRFERTNLLYVGYVSNVEDVYRMCDLMLLPTTREGLPSVVLEAAACGTPTVANAVTGTVDAIVDGLTGYLVQVGDARAMADRACELLTDQVKRNRMGCAARRYVSQRYNQEQLWQALLPAYLGTPKTRSTSVEGSRDN